jgi:hypothetical protein
MLHETRRDNMLRINFLILLISASVLSGCGPAQFPKSDFPQIPALEGKWQIQMTQSGGIMGLSKSIVIRPEGTFTINDLRTGNTFTGNLSADELAGLVKQVASAVNKTVDGPEKYGCADCFLYDLKISSNGQTFSVKLNDISLPKSGLEPLVTNLLGIMKKGLK